MSERARGVALIADPPPSLQLGARVAIPPVAGLVTFIRGVPSTWTGATLVNVSPVLTALPPYKKPS